MPAKRRAPARRTLKRPSRTPVAKKKATAKKKAVATTRAGVAKKARPAGFRGVPGDLVRLAERSARADEKQLARDHERMKQEHDVEEGSTLVLTPTEGPEEPAAIRERLSEASVEGTVVDQRRQDLTAPAPADTMLGEVEQLRYAPHPAAASHGSGDVVIDVEDLHVFYGAVQALKGMSFQVRAGETVSIIGSNGAGKTTTLKTVSGVSELLKSVRGTIRILGNRVETWPAHRIARLGVAHSPEGRKVFPNQTVRDNLMIGAFGRKDSEIDSDIRRMEERFPILGKRRNQAAGLMSGGEQQMLAMARALMARPTVLLFDEPSMGLAPLIVKQIFEILEELKNEGKTILLVEQMAFQALGIADRAYVLETGEITMEGTGRDLLEDPRVKEAYLGA